MSVVLSLTSAAIIACASVSSISALTALSLHGAKEEELSFETIFNDKGLLLKTLTDHGCCVQEHGENELAVETSFGTLRYIRADAAQPYRLYLGDVADPAALMEEMRLFETEYGRNVQSYTYHHIKQNLTEDMSVVSEAVLEDDSLLLTISL